MYWCPNPPEPWSSLAIVALTSLLGSYSWRHRREPGATPFAVACVFAVLWAVGAAAESAACEASTRIAWYLFKVTTLLPIVCAITAFVLEYAGLGRWVTRKAIVWAGAVPSLVVAALAASNGVHGLFWREVSVADGTVSAPAPGPAGWAFLGYQFVLALVIFAVLLRLAVTSPARRGPVVLMLIGLVFSRAAFLFEIFAHGSFVTREPEVAGVGVAFALYGVSLFGLHVFNPVPAARAAAVDQMRDGVVVLDPQGVRIVYVNPAAERLLGRSRHDLHGHRWSRFLPADALVGLDNPGVRTASISIGEDAGRREVMVTAVDLVGRTGQHLGRLLTLRDVTDDYHALASRLDQERALAALREREHLARELHDSVGQVLGYLSLQAQAAEKWLVRGDVAKATSLLSRLTDAAQGAHGDVREAILALKAQPDAEWSFLNSLRAYGRDFERQYGIATAVTTGADLSGDPLDQAVGVQALRVVQEAMSNARRHGGAGSVSIHVERLATDVRVTVTDDGAGFVPSPGPSVGHYGITFMRERMAEIDGSVTFSSRPGEGTDVTLTIPIRREGNAA